MNNKSNRIYGRAQRLEFFEKVAYFLIAIFVIILVFVILSNQKEKVDDNINFSYLRDYMESNGYSCEMIHQNGGSCTLNGDNSKSIFIRTDDGFEFIKMADAYNLDIKHNENEDIFTFITSSSALSGYKNKNYVCSYKDNILSDLDKCIDDNDEELTSNAYISVIERAIIDINNFIDSSGYDKDILLNDNEWRKK